ncbi:MAG: 30S ribosomal protein S2 [Alphaproteobacteria bacterium]
MALPEFTMRQLLEAGVHFGHQTRRWNPKMGPFIFGVRNSVHILDLQQTVPMFHQALGALRDVAAGGGRILFVGTKRQASEPIADAARRSGQYYVNHRWLGGMMTNWKAVSGSIKTLINLEEQLADENLGLTKKEVLHLTRRRDKLDRALGGIKDMGGVPDILVVIDTNKEDIAVMEARKLGIPVVAVVDSNCDPELITYPIPGNDDAIRAVNFYCDLFARAIIDGLQQELADSGADIGESLEAPVEEIPAESSAENAALKEEKVEQPSEPEAKVEQPLEPEAKVEQPSELGAVEEQPSEPEAEAVAKNDTVEQPAEAQPGNAAPVNPAAGK